MGKLFTYEPLVLFEQYVVRQRLRGYNGLMVIILSICTVLSTFLGGFLHSALRTSCILFSASAREPHIRLHWERYWDDTRDLLRVLFIH
jgi:hypothetical protein